MCGGNASNSSVRVETINLSGFKGDLFPIYDERYALLIVNTYQLENALNDTVLQVIMLNRWNFALDKIYILIDSYSLPDDARLVLLKNLEIDGKKINVVYNNGSDFLERYNEILGEINNERETSLYLAVSSHGSQVPDNDGDEPDDFDEAIYPNGVRIRDDSLYSGLQILPKNFNVLILTDTCNSGSMFDLSKQNLQAKIISLGASADDQLSYEVSYNPRLINLYLDNELPLDPLLEFTSAPKIIGSLTFAILTVIFDKEIMTDLNVIDIKNMEWLLTQLSQTLTLQQTRSVSKDVPSPWMDFVWLIICLVFLGIIIFVLILISRIPNHVPSSVRISSYN